MKIILDLEDNDTRVKMMEAYIEKYFGKEFRVTGSGYTAKRIYGETFYREFHANIEKK